MRVGAVRETVGRGITIRLDGNPGLALPDALSLVRATRDFGIELFEQPARADDQHGLRTVREAGIRVLVDESVHSVRDAIRVLEASACDLIARVAAAYGIGCILISPLRLGRGTTRTIFSALPFRRAAHGGIRRFRAA